MHAMHTPDTTPTAPTAPTAATAGTGWPARVCAPYCDVTLWPTPDLAEFARETGLRHVTLAFVVAGGAGGAAGGAAVPAWGGITPVSTGFMAPQIAAFRALGGDVCVSFGGASGTELACAVADVDALVAAYQSVIDRYRVTRLDFDVEGAACADRPSVVRRNRALAKLQAANGGRLRLSYTLPCATTGLTPDGVYVLRSAARAGVHVDHIRVMTMDFGPPIADMGAAVIAAAKGVKKQLGGMPAYATTGVGIIPMIGCADVPGEIFGLDAAQKVVTWARGMRWVKMLSFWSIARDRPGQPGVTAPDGSGVSQTPWDFSKIFKAYS